MNIARPMEDLECCRRCTGCLFSSRRLSFVWLRSVSRPFCPEEEACIIYLRNYATRRRKYSQRPSGIERKVVVFSVHAGSPRELHISK